MRPSRPPAPSIRTVLGPIDPSDLGLTSIHDHALAFVDHLGYRPIDTDQGRMLGEQPVSFQNLWYVRANWTAVRDNLRITDEEVSTREIARLAAAGGSGSRTSRGWTPMKPSRASSTAASRSFKNFFIAQPSIATSQPDARNRRPFVASQVIVSNGYSA